MAGDTMQPIEVLRIIQQAVQDVRNKNEEVVSTDALLKYIDGLAGQLESSKEEANRRTEANLAIFRAEHERNVALYQSEQKQALELFRSVVTYGSAAMKSALLINGGAAVALLAFIGNIWEKETAPEAVKALTLGIAMFSTGVLAAAVANAMSYFTQYCYSDPFPRAAVVFHTLTVLFVVTSFVLFGYGAYESYSAFAKHLARQDDPA